MKGNKLQFQYQLHTFKHSASLEQSLANQQTWAP